MLFDVAAIALTSGALGGVTEAFVVHENSQFQSSITALFDPVSNVLTSDPTDASPLALAAPVNPSMLPKLSGSALLDQLTLIPSSKIARYMAGNPAAVSRMLVDPPMAASVTSWWSGLSSATKRSLSASAPELIGNLDGLPFATRDAANRSYLAKSLAETRATLSQGAGRGSLVDERRKYEVLLQVNRALVTAPGKPIRQLLTFDPEGEGRAAIAVGDLATADYVSYMVPGMFFTLQGQMADWTTIAQNLYNEQASWLTRLDKLDSTRAGKSAATVAWIGYATPGVLDVASLDRANQGAQFLGNAIQGIKAARAGNEPYVTLVTHSYGSTAAMIELAKGGVSVDALAMVGSPGGAAQRASALAVKNDNVFVGEAAWDPVVNSAFYGSDPGSPAFGAHVMSVAGGVDAITKKTMSASLGHLGYFQPGSEAMRNIALIGLGENSLVTDGTHADASRTLASR